MYCKFVLLVPASPGPRHPVDGAARVRVVEVHDQGGHGLLRMRALDSPDALHDVGFGRHQHEAV